jgi:hypothetical protein
MDKLYRWMLVALVSAAGSDMARKPAVSHAADTMSPDSPADGTPLKTPLAVSQDGDDLLLPNAWRPWREGFRRDGTLFVCDNGNDTRVQRGVSQSVELNQRRPEPIVAIAFSKAEGVTGSSDADYSLYLDLLYVDGTPLWGQIAPFTTGTHHWQRRQVVIIPEKPVRQVSFHMLLRSHGGKAWFRDPQLFVVRAPDRDRAITLVYAVPIRGEGLRWCHDPRQTLQIEPQREYINAARFRVATGRLSRYPLAAVAHGRRGIGLGIDMARPAFFRIGYNAGTGELFAAYDIGLTAEKPAARVRFCRFEFDPKWEFRAALARPDAGRDGHRDELEPGRRLAAHVRC